ncbi:MAG: hypothetical protein NTW96_19910 [Planctomycetia bacterium]|nr:hypothetical protein [Planctomycetia bacterium]
MKPNRAAFSLLEVLLATSLLLACAVVLAELANIGRAHAKSADELASAQLACQTKLNEILCGATPAATVEKQPLEDMPGWLLSVEITSLEQPGLAALRVTVAEDVEDLDDKDQQRGKAFSLVRWIRDPYGQASGSGFLTEPWSRTPLDGGSPP